MKIIGLVLLAVFALWAFNLYQTPISTPSNPKLNTWEWNAASGMANGKVIEGVIRDGDWKIVHDTVQAMQRSNGEDAELFPTHDFVDDPLPWILGGLIVLVILGTVVILYHSEIYYFFMEEDEEGEVYGWNQDGELRHD